MVPWEFIDSAPVPGSGETLRLMRRGEEFSIRTDHCELMNSRSHGSEEALAELACARIADHSTPRVLIGGLGMGYTVAAALRRIGADAGVVVAELVPAVVAWNRKYLGHLAGHPLRDTRVTVRTADVAGIVKAAHRAWDGILLDVDNGPEGLTRQGNDRLYSKAGLNSAFDALLPGGVLAVWSATPCHGFTRRLSRIGFEVETVRVRARGPGRGSRHTVWIAGRKS